MLLVVPISKSDAHLTDALVRAFQTFTPGNNHRLLVVSDPKAQADSSVLLGKLREYFTEAQQEVFSGDAQYDWPIACNYYFQQTAYLVNRHVSPTEGWMWMEMDSTPIAPNWLSIIEQEYYSDNTIAFQERRGMYRYMGATERTVTSKMGEKYEDGVHMAPVGVYPGDFAVQCPVLKSVAGVQQKNHFSVHLKWYPIKGLNKTPLIQNNRETTNYREENGHIVCDSIARNVWQIHYNEPISENAVLVHGCKDGSLIGVIPHSRTVQIAVREVRPPAPPQIQPNQKQKILVGRPNPIAQPRIPNMPASGKLQSTPVVHTPLPQPAQIMKFGQLANSGANKSQSHFSETGEAIAPPVEVPPSLAIPAPAVLNVGTPPPLPPVAEPPTPEAAPVIVEQAKVVKRTKASARKNAWTPERRAKQAEIFKARMAAKNAAPEPAPV